MVRVLAARWGSVYRLLVDVGLACLIVVGTYQAIQGRQLAEDNRNLIKRQGEADQKFRAEQQRVDALFAETLKGGCSQSNQAKNVVRDLVSAVLTATKNAPLRPGQTEAERQQSVMFFQIRLDKINGSITDCKAYVAAAQGKEQSAQ